MLRFAFNLAITFGLIYCWAALGLIVPNLTFDLPYLNIPAHYHGLALLALGAFLFQVGRTVLETLYGLFLVGTLGLGCITLPLYWVLFGFSLFKAIEILGIWTIPAAPLLLFIIGLITSVVQIPKIVFNKG
jgi:hypothetical protein